MDNFCPIYDALIAGITPGCRITGSLADACWSAVHTEDQFGIAMTTPGDTIRPMFPPSYEGMELAELAKAAKSWNLAEASYGMAAINAFYNTPQRMEALHAAEPFDRYCTAGLDLRNKRIGVVGHLNMPDFVRQQAAELLILERNPQPGDYPDSACEWILPTCDIVLITGSTLANKTLPRLLELTRNAVTILTGPSVPLCPALLELGIDRIAGLVITDRPGMIHKIQTSRFGPPYPYGQSFLLTRDRQ